MHCLLSFPRLSNFVGPGKKLSAHAAGPEAIPDNYEEAAIDSHGSKKKQEVETDERGFPHDPPKGLSATERGERKRFGLAHVANHFPQRTIAGQR